MTGIVAIGASLFVLAAACYLLFITSDPLEELGGRLGKLLRLPEDVIASTFQALATSGPEIIMAILAATPFIASEVWATLALEEKAASGTLNMAFSAMDNLLGIGAVAMLFMIHRRMAEPDDLVKTRPSTVIGLTLYIISSGSLAIFIMDEYLTVSEAWTLMGIGIVFVLSQFFLPALIERRWPSGEDNGTAAMEYPTPHPIAAPASWTGEFLKTGFLYAFLVYGMIIFVREALGATFTMASIGIASLGGILLLFTSYVSSFPEFVMAIRYTLADKRSSLMGMLFGSNVIDLAFSGFRAMYLGEEMRIVTSGPRADLLPYYIWALPVVAMILLIMLGTGTLRWKHARLMVGFYLIYIFSGFFLL